MTGWKAWGLLALILAPGAVAVVKALDLPGGSALAEVASLGALSPGLEEQVGYVLFVPLATVAVVFTRVTLGLRVLGPFRSVLLALAFGVTGIPLGLIFLLLVIAVVVAVRPLVRSVRLPYFARVSVSLSAVAAVLVLAIVVGRLLGPAGLERVAYLPIVVLCLAADGFAKTLRREGLRSAAARGFWTSAVAIAIAAVATIPGLRPALVRYPELLLLEIGVIVLISEYMGFRLFAPLNPEPKP